MRRVGAHAALLWQALARFFVDQGPEHAGNLAFLGTLALFPFLIFLLSLSGLFGQTAAGHEAIDFLLMNLPEPVSGALGPAIRRLVEATDRGVLTGAVLLALYSSINGLEAARRTVIHAYGSWDYAAPLWRRAIADLVIVLVGSLAIILVTALTVFLPPLISLVESWLPLPAIVHDLSLVGRVVFAPLLMFLTPLVAYRLFAPRMPGQRRYYLPGALLTLLVWLALAKGMALYLEYAARYDLIYGSLAGLVLLELFLYLVAAAFILGAHLNACYSRSRGRTATAGDGATGD
ncbi:MAG: YihY/virulence factor BrkB family protein [Rhodothalassiaceae bacterium]